MKQKQIYLEPIGLAPDYFHYNLINTIEIDGFEKNGLSSLSISQSGEFIVSTSKSGVTVWDIVTGEERFFFSTMLSTSGIGSNGEIFLCKDGIVNVLDGKTGRELYSFKGSNPNIGGPAEIDGEIVISYALSNSIVVLDGRTGEIRLEFEVGEESIGHCIMSGDGTVFVTISDTNIFNLWNTRTGKLIKQIIGPSNIQLLSSAIDWNGTTIASNFSDKSLVVWNSQTGLKKFVHLDIVPIQSGSKGCAVSGDGSIVVSVYNDYGLMVWDGHTGEKRFSLPGNPTWIEGCALSRDGKTLVSGSIDETLKIWDLQKKSPSENPVFNQPVFCVAANNEVSILVIGSSEGHAWIFDAIKGSFGPALPGLPPENVYGCAISDDGKKIVTVSEKGSIKTWNIIRSDQFSTDNCAVVMMMNTSFEDDKIFLSSSKRKEQRVQDALGSRVSLFKDGSKLRNIHIEGQGFLSWKKMNPNIGFWDCAINQDGTKIVAAATDRTLIVWDQQWDKENLILSGHEDWVTGCSFLGDGSVIISSSMDHTLKLWDAVNGKELCTLRSHSGTVNDCCISGENDVIVSASKDNTLKIWDYIPEKRIAKERITLHGHTDEVTGCAIDRLGELVVSTSADRTIKVWDAFTGICLTTFHAAGRLMRCAFLYNQDIKVIIVGGDTGLYFFRLTTSQTGVINAEPLFEKENNRAFLETMNELGHQYSEEYFSGNRDVIQSLKQEENNLLCAIRLARQHELWHHAIGPIHGLKILYDHTGCKAEWKDLLNEIIPAFVNSEDDMPIHGREDQWKIITNYRINLAKEERRFKDAEILQTICVELNREMARSHIGLPQDQIDSENRNTINSYSISLFELAQIQIELGKRECVRLFEESLRLCQLIGDISGAATTAYNLGHAYKDISAIQNLDKAHIWYLCSYDLRSETDCIGKARCIYQLGAVAFARMIEAVKLKRLRNEIINHADIALKYYFEGLDMLSTDAVYDLAVVHQMIGNIYSLCQTFHINNSFDQASTHFQEAINYFEIQSDLYNAAKARTGFAIALYQNRCRDDSLEYAYTALRNFESFGDRAKKDIERMREIIAMIEN